MLSVRHTGYGYITVGNDSQIHPMIKVLYNYKDFKRIYAITRSKRSNNIYTKRNFVWNFYDIVQNLQYDNILLASSSTKSFQI